MKRVVLGTVTWVALISPLSCGAPVRDPDRRDRGNGAVASVFVTITEGARGTVAMPLPFSTTGVTFTLRIEARGADHRPVSGFHGHVALSVTPGVLQRIEGPGVVGRSVRLSDGVAEGIRVTFARAYGETRIWAEEQGYDPADPNTGRSPACANGIDDDGDGRLDFPGDYGCAAPNDDSETGGSYAAGASEPIHFGSPRIYDVQGGAATTPLLNERVTIDRGTLVVTRVSVSGFWVTDISDTSCSGRPCYNSLFAFNFRLPEGMRPCDRLSRLQGTVQEFVSTTQLSQPSWRVAPDGLWISPERSGDCPIPEPVTIAPTALANPDVDLEPYESSLVRVTDVVLAPNIGPDRVSCRRAGSTLACDFAPGRSNCDRNDDGVINFDDPDEGGCANTCQRTPGCSEWTNWVRFGQLAVDFAAGQPAGVSRLIIAPREAISDFNPLMQPVNPGEAVTVTGTLKQVGPNWIVEPRCTEDLVIPHTGMTVRRANQSCVTPRTVTEEP